MLRNASFIHPSQPQPEKIIASFITALKTHPTIAWPNDADIAQHLLDLTKVRCPSGMRKSQFINYLAVQFLEDLGYDCPHPDLIDQVESLLARTLRKLHASPREVGVLM